MIPISQSSSSEHSSTTANPAVALRVPDVCGGPDHRRNPSPDELQAHGVATDPFRSYTGPGKVWDGRYGESVADAAEAVRPGGETPA
ncbi:hypothetical protein IF1G_03934 [Cordyceps javanica]|uniref:Uncharacterized protein n=1 Tax=Cordyceps javanica TaxID=43265 RepID=A0A545V8Y3_9HYPO|nr:hypothetical protein IF1G_03934 [Cordyceps javanica]TQW08636.1 hypothetical protein IF2G_03067 [Cordyceps javanica]